MKKELPSMYKNIINKNLNNTQTEYSTLDQIKEQKDSVRRNSIDSRLTIEQKINKIFSANDYIYKADVTIVTNNETLHKRIIGKVNNNLLTMDNESIPISSIIDIYK